MGFAQQAKLMLPIGHTASVMSAQFSPDGKKIVTASGDFTAKIWDAASGNLIADLKGHTNEVLSAQISPDGNKIVTTSMDGTAKIWDAAFGNLIADLKGYSFSVNSAWFSPDGKKIVTASDYEGTKIWDAASGKLILNLEGHSDRVNFAQFSPDGKKIVSASNDQTAKIWNATSGKLIANLKGHTGWVTSAQFSPDGKKIVTTSTDSTAKIWDAASGRLIVDTKEHTGSVLSAQFSPDGKKIVTTSKDHTAKLWDAASGRLIVDINGHAGSVMSAQFSPDGKKIVTASSDYTAKIWDASTGNFIVDLKGHTFFVKSAQISPEGEKIATINDYTVKLWDAASGKLINDLAGHIFYVSSVQFSPDGKKVVTASEDHTAKIWDASSGNLIADLKGHVHSVNSAQFSPDGKKVVTASDDQTAKIWDASSGNLIADLIGHMYGVISAGFSPDGKKIVTTSKNGTAKIWDASSGNLNADLIGHINAVNSAGFSPDGKKIVTTSRDYTAKIWDASSGKLIVNMEEFLKTVNSAQFSPDGKKIVITYEDAIAKIWDAVSGIHITDLIGHKNAVTSAGFSPDGKKIVTASTDKTAKIWDAASGNLIADLKGHTDWLTSAQFSPDGKKIITASYDHTTKIWNAGTGKALYTFFAVDSTDYLIVDTLNRYDGTEAARKLLYFTCGTEVIELDQVKDQLWVPNLAVRINNGETINAKTLDELNLCGLTPAVEEASSKADEYYFEITPRRGGLGETVLNVNGIEVRRYKPGQLIKRGEVYQLTVKKEYLRTFFIDGQKNPVSVKAYTAGNDISSRSVIADDEDPDKQSKTPPNLYAVMIGVSDYKGDEMDLKYAAKDAGDISHAVAITSRKLLNADSKEHVFMYNLTTDTGYYRLPEKAAIKKTLEDIGKKAMPNDILFIFFAGHGTMTGEKKQFYFLTADASKSSAVSATSDVGISMNELTEWIKPQNIKAQKRILIFDACKSGQAIIDFVKMGAGDQSYLASRDDEKGQEIKAIEKLNEKSGLFILSASASNQNAYELGRIRQGVLTYSLLKAIKQEPDILQSGKYLDVSRWFNAAEKTVSDISKENNSRQQPQIVSNTNFSIGIVDEEVMAKIILPIERPLFRASNLQNSDESIAADDLGLSKLIDNSLSAISARNNGAITFIPATNTPDAYSLAGRYEIKGNNIMVKINIRRNKEVNKFEVSGTTEKLNELAAAIAGKAAELVK